MVYYQKIIITVSAVGWQHVEQAYANADEDGKLSINEVLAESKHIVSDDGDHLINIDWTKSNWKDLVSFRKLLSNYEDEYYYLAMEENGTEEMFGNMDCNPFCVDIKHDLYYDDSIPAVKFGAFSTLASSVTATTVAVNESLVNDHTCGHCGNNRCSKQEKTCWKCGATI